MANHKSAKKRAKQNIVRNNRNKVKKTKSRNVVQKLRNSIKSGNKEQALELLKQAQSSLARVAKTSAVHAKTASRKTSRLAAQVAKM